MKNKLILIRNLLLVLFAINVSHIDAMNMTSSLQINLPINYWPKWQINANLQKDFNLTRQQGNIDLNSSVTSTLII